MRAVRGAMFRVVTVVALIAFVVSVLFLAVNSSDESRTANASEPQDVQLDISREMQTPDDDGGNTTTTEQTTVLEPEATTSTTTSAPVATTTQASTTAVARTSTTSTTTTTTKPKTVAVAKTAVTTPTTKPRPTTTTTTKPTMSLLTAQRLLKDNGYWLADPNGRSSGTTTQALYAFQKMHDLKRSGALDAATIEALANIQRPAPFVGMQDGVQINLEKQVIVVIRGGTVQWVFNTSTGNGIPYTENGVSGSAQTPQGSFTVVRDVNALDDGPLGGLYRPKYFTWTGIAIHGAASVPPYPASHGCARVSNAAMDFIWDNNFLPIGARIVVL